MNRIFNIFTSSFTIHGTFNLLPFLTAEQYAALERIDPQNIPHNAAGIIYLQKVEREHRELPKLSNAELIQMVIDRCQKSNEGIPPMKSDIMIKQSEQSQNTVTVAQETKNIEELVNILKKYMG